MAEKVETYDGRRHDARGGMHGGTHGETRHGARKEQYDRTLSRARRRAAGVFYTPPALVARVVDETLGRRLSCAEWRHDGSPRLRVLDPAAGDGRFLLACVERIAEEAATRGFDRARARQAAVRRCVVGVDRDPDAAARARAALGPGADVRVGEALFGGVIEEGAWDVVVGNPPWVRSVTLKREDPQLWARLRGAMRATSYREWDLYAAFLERSLDWAAEDAEIGLVVPSRWLTAAFAAPLRERLAREGAVRKLVDYGATQLFEGATTYTALVFLTRRKAATIEIERGEARGVAPVASLGRGPWTFDVGARPERLARLRAVGPPLGQVARVSKGAGTNADGVFLLEEGQARAAGIEPDALVPCLRGRDVESWRAVVRRLALFPYDRHGALLSPDALRRKWPGAAAWLDAHRAILEAREGGRYAGETFYRWGRPQNLVWLRDPAPKIVVPDAASRGRAALDTAGTLVIDTAYAIRPHDPTSVPPELLLAVLNSPVVAEWLRLFGIPLRGGYFRMKTAYLASLPIPDPGSPAARHAISRVRAGEPFVLEY